VDARLSDYISAFDVEALWPLFAHYSWEKRGGVRGGHTHIFPLYWSSWKDDIGYRMLFPFYWSYWSKRESWAHLFPFYGEYRQGSYRKTFLLDPLFSWGRDSATEQWDVNLFWPLAHFEGGKKRSSGRIVPFLFYGESPERSYAVVPPVYFYHLRKGESGTRVLFPFYWDHWEETGDRARQQVIFPFYGRFEWPGEKGLNRLETLFPIYWKYRGKTSADVLFPLYWDFRGTEARTRLLLPFWLQHKEKGARTEVLFPFYFGHRGKTSADVLFPLYWDFRGAEERTRFILPLWFERKEKGYKAEILFPFYWNFGKTEGADRTLTVPPFYFLKEELDGASGVQAVTPFFWNWWNPEAKGWVLLPLYGRHRGKDLRLDTVLPPLIWSTRAGGTKGFIVAPFWWQFKNEGEGRFFRSFFPLYWDWKEGHQGARGTVLIPFYTRITTAKGEKGIVVLPPYLNAWSGKTSWTLLPPFYAEVRNRVDQWKWRSVLPPFYWWVRGRGYETDFLPPWWRTTNHLRKTTAQGFFPLYWDWRNDRKRTHTSLLLPFYADVDTGSRGERFFVSPLVWGYSNREKASHLEGVFPLYWDFSWKGGKEKFSSLFPFVWRFKNPEWSADYVFPFWGRYSKADGYRKDFFLFPLASVEREPKKGRFGFDVLWPLFAYHDTPDSLSWRALPFWLHHQRKSDGRKVDFILPFVCTMRARDYHYRHVFPFYFDYLDKRGGPGKRSGWSSVLGPLWMHTFDERRALSRDDVLWPLFTVRRRGDALGVSLRPLFYHTAEKGASGTVCLPFLFHRQDAKGSDTAVPPLFWQQIREERTSRLILPLYFEDSGPKDGTRILFPFHWNFWSRNRSHIHWWPFVGFDRKENLEGKAWRQTSFLYPFFRFETDDRTGREVKVHAPWPLVRYRHRVPSGDFTFQGLPFVYAWGKRGKGDLVGLLPPMWWHWTKTERTLLLPFYYHHRNQKTDRTENVVFPFLWSFESPRTSTFHLWPLFGRRIRNDDAGKMESLEVSAGWPLLFNYRRNVPKDRTKLDVLWPLFAYSREPEAVHTRLLPLWWYEADEKRETLVAPLSLYNRRGKSWDLSVLFPLFHMGRYEKNRARQLDVLWPLFSVYQGEDGPHPRLLPLWWYDRFGKRETLLAPLSLYSRRGSDRDLALLFPLFHYGEYPSQKAWKINLVWPLFSASKTRNRFHSHLLPLWWHDVALHGRRLHLRRAPFPLAKYRRDAARDEMQLDLLWPLFSVRREKDALHTRLLPLWWHDADEDESLTVVPPLLSFHRRKGDSGFGSVLFPLTWYAWEKGKSFEMRLLWELASYREVGQDAWDFRILYKFLHLSRRGPRFEFELMPFFRFETTRGRLTHFSLLGGALFSYDYDVKRRRSETSLFYFIRF
jgi:hypothetical protein